ncbi:anti-phage ZorAB system protein ZorA [Frateuria sp. STR12]|uniref:anti-phage ZorAB system protein ZorA n=1 Tax=Frateuria hangzhouensis TaxID=2995589 RepID=UPI002260B630|nr:anti-phage ZorAB system protein ZorA [Frateuria sp. STR12]MCX7512577.1 anti-phage ZorAB system protein ZorA [Frateuria sp. STR12]
MSDFLHLVTADWLHQLLAGVLLVLVLFFIWHVLIKGLWLTWRLGQLRKKIGALGKEPPARIKAALTRVFEGTPWKDAWREYEETLHEQVDPSRAEPTVLGVRATVQAEAFFHTEALVDDPLHIEFYKHLPGILTGIGIIATFLGLITGLQQFDASATEPEALKHSLSGLFDYVRHAFMFSALAIGMAMLLTILEKVIFNLCVHRAVGVAAELDALFRAGLGEEYLSRLVKSSEDGATQTKHLKESLVQDLKALLTNLTEQQIQATRQLSSDIGQSLHASLQEPLQKIADTVERASGDQSANSARMLENLMSAFMAQMKETMGGQLGDLSGLMQQTTQAVAQVESTLRGLVADMERSSQASASGMQAAVKGLIQSLADHQNQLAQSAATQQSQALDQMQEALQRMAEAQEASMRRTQEASSTASEQIGRVTAQSISASQQATEAAQALLSGVQQVSIDAIQGLEQGATRIAASVSAMDAVAERLTRAGQSLSGLQEQSMEATGKLERASTTLGTGAQTLSQAMTALGQASMRFEGVSGLMASETQAREVTLREIQSVLVKSREASELFGQLTGEVEKHLVDGVDRFGDATSKVLDNVLKQYDNALGSTVSMLKETMDELRDATADRIGVLER